jgi:hypothetical protein
MPVETLTKNLVKDSICPSGKHKVDIHDSGCKGLLLEVRATGGKTYYFRYRDDRSKVRQMRIGAEDTLTLKQARTLCDRHRSKLAMGEDPWATKAELRRVPKLETFIYESFLPFIKTYKRSWDTDQSLLKNHIVPTFGHLYMDQLNKKHVIDFIGKHIMFACDVSRASLIFMYSTCFGSLMHKIASKLGDEAPEGCLVSTTTYAINHPGFELVKHFPAKSIAWTDLRIYRRVGKGPWPEQKQPSSLGSDPQKWKESARELLRS